VVAVSGRYRVVVTRDETNWLAEVPEVPGVQTFARALAPLDGEVREAVAIALDLSPTAERGLVLDYEYHLGDAEIDARTARLRAERVRHAAAERELVEQTGAAARDLVARGLSVRDAAVLLAVTPQRIHQLAPGGGRSG
jgi:predicted RNase H-like HicB family nuclease